MKGIFTPARRRARNTTQCVSRKVSEVKSISCTTTTTQTCDSVVEHVRGRRSLSSNKFLHVCIRFISTVVSFYTRHFFHDPSDCALPHSHSFPLPLCDWYFNLSHYQKHSWLDDLLTLEKWEKCVTPHHGQEERPAALGEEGGTWHLKDLRFPNICCFIYFSKALSLPHVFCAVLDPSLTYKYRDTHTMP